MPIAVVSSRTMFKAVFRFLLSEAHIFRSSEIATSLVMKLGVADVWLGMAGTASGVLGYTDIRESLKPPQRLNL